MRDPRLAVRSGARLALAVAAVFSAPAYANPTGPVVTSGAAVFSQPSPSVMQIVNTPGTIINWQGFSIGAGELTRFLQQSAASAVLNRVTGADPSSILGALSSNGRVFLVNPHGIVFGAGSRIDAAGFVASTLNISDRDFLAGRLRFEGGGHGVLRNEGAIRASGDIFLVGPQIENAGAITSDAGSVMLAAGRSVNITSPDAHGVQFALQAPEDSAVNLGTISAANAASMFAGTLRHSGDIRATSASVDAAGRVVLAAQTDAILDGNATISVDNIAGKGGSVQITGERVGLFDTASVSARGATGGGEILVGGDYRGANPGVRNSTATVVASGATLDASAAAAGDGGKVIVWSDDSTHVHGAVLARGGENGGKGGFVETSGKRQLDVRGVALDLRGADGGGEWLLDPTNIVVVAAAGTPPADTSEVEAATIVGQLDAGTNVTLTTSGAGSAAGNIVVSSAIVKTAANTASLTLNAINQVQINAAIDTTDGNLTITAPGGTTMSANVSTTALTAGNFTQNSGTLTLAAGSSSVGNYTLNGGILTGDGMLNVTGAFSLTGSGSNMTGNGSTVLAGGFNGSGRTVNRNLTVNGLTTVGPANTLTISAGKTLTVAGGMTAQTNSGNSPSETTIAGPGTLAIPAGQTFTFSPVVRGLHLNNVTVDNSGTYTHNGNTTFLNSVVFNNLAGGQLLFATADPLSGSGTLNNFGTIATNSTINGTLSVTNAIFHDGSVLAPASGRSISFSGTTAYDGAITINDGAFRLTGGAQTFADGVTLGGTGSLVQIGAGVTMNDVTANVPYTLSPTNTLTIASGKTFTVAGGMTAQTSSANSPSETTIAGPGTLAIPAGQTFTFSPVVRGLHLNNVTVDNSGTYTHNGNTTFLNSVVFNNLAGGQLLFATVDPLSGSGTLNNYGTINATAFNGTIGTSAGLTALAGTINVGAGRTLNVGGTGLNWQGGTLAGAGTYNLTGGLSITGSGTRVLDGPTFNVAGLNLPGGSLDVQAGALNLSGTTTVAAGASLISTGGTLGIAGPLNNNGTFTKASAGTTAPTGLVTNSGTLNANAGVLDLSGGYADAGGVLALGGGGVTAPAAGLDISTGTLRGIGTVTGNVVNNGAVTVGASPGTLIVNGNYTQGAAGVLNMELGGTNQGVDYDLLQVTGTANLGGTLNVSLFGGFTGLGGNQFDLITYANLTGDFATRNLPAGHTYLPTLNPTFFRLTIDTPAAVVVPSGRGASPDPLVPVQDSELRVLNDRFLVGVEEEEKSVEEENNMALSCR